VSAVGSEFDDMYVLFAVAAVIDVETVVDETLVAFVATSDKADSGVEGSLKELEMLSTFEGNEGEKDITHTRDCTAGDVSTLTLLTLYRQAVQADRREQ